MNKKGVTIVELVLYIAILSVVLLGIVSFTYIIMTSKAKSQAISQVEQNGLGAMQIIGRAIRNSSGVNSPTKGDPATTTLSLAMTDLAKNPTVFTLASGVLYMQEGAGSAVALTSNRVVASDLGFRNVGRTLGTKSSLKINFTLTHINPANNSSFQFSRIFYDSASLR